MSIRLLLALGTLSLVSLAGCAVDTGTTDEGQTAESADEARRLTPCATMKCANGFVCVAKGGTGSCVAGPCASDKDCEVLDNYCDGCACDAHVVGAPILACSGTTVACFAQPCMGKTAVCKAGTCQVTTKTANAAGEKCGSGTCKVGDVCCNSSCGICTPPGGMCTQQFCGGEALPE